MEKLEEILRKIRAFGGKITFKDGDVYFWEDGQGETLYIDRRTTYDIDWDYHLVSPIAFEGGDYYYICPNCQQIHKTKKMEQYRGYFTPDCKNKQYGRGRKGMMYVLVDGKMVKVQVTKMRLRYK